MDYKFHFYPVGSIFIWDKDSALCADDFEYASLGILAIGPFIPSHVQPLKTLTGFQQPQEYEASHNNLVSIFCPGL